MSSLKLFLPHIPSLVLHLAGSMPEKCFTTQQFKLIKKKMLISKEPGDCFIYKTTNNSHFFSRTERSFHNIALILVSSLLLVVLETKIQQVLCLQGNAESCLDLAVAGWHSCAKKCLCCTFHVLNPDFLSVLHVGSRLSPILDIFVDQNLCKLFKWEDQTKFPPSQTGVMGGLYCLVGFYPVLPQMSLVLGVSVFSIHLSWLLNLI